MHGVSVSVVIPTHNRARLVLRAVNSALSAIDKDDEIIVVDDGSTDATKDVLAPYASRITYILLPHAGAGKARNEGIRAASKDLVAFLDSDDEWFTDKINLQKAVMAARPDALFCFSDFGVKLETGQIEHRYLKHWHNDGRPWDEILAPGTTMSALTQLPEGRSDFKVYAGNMFLMEMLRPYIFTSTLIVRRSLAGDALHFAEDVPTMEDWECFGRLAAIGLALFLDCETAWQWGHSLSRLSDAAPLLRATAALRILPRVWGSNGAFMREHGVTYNAELRAQRLLKLTALLMERRGRHARYSRKYRTHQGDMRLWRHCRKRLLDSYCGCANQSCVVKNNQTFAIEMVSK